MQNSMETQKQTHRCMFACACACVCNCIIVWKVFKLYFHEIQQKSQPGFQKSSVVNAIL